MFYTRLAVSCTTDYVEILMAEVGEAGFDSFMETEQGFEAYVEMESFQRELLREIEERYREQLSVRFVFDKVAKENWNEQWEKNYEPIIVDNRCLIRASFHKIEGQFPYEIIITPKMSFGTGHHQTTYLMIKNQMSIDHEDKRVMDAGCGTAILSIMASKLGAAEVHGFDIDEWSMVNGQENVEVNACNNVHLQKGTVNEVHLEPPFDIVLANINKNVLLSEVGTYSQLLKGSGLLLMSGFYVGDISDLLKECERHGLFELSRDERETWAALLLKKH